MVLSSLFYDKLINANYEFVAQIDPGFLNKMVLFDIDPITEFICVFPALSSAPLTTIFAFVMIWTQLDFSWYFSLVIVFYLLTLYLTRLLMKSSVGLRKKYRQTITAIHGYLDTYIKKIKYIKINSLEEVLMKDIQKIRRDQQSILDKLNNYDTFIEMMFFTPTLATSLLVMALQRFIEKDFDVVQIFTVISALAQLKRPILTIAEATDKYADYKKSYRNYMHMLKDIPDKPKTSLLSVSHPDDLSHKSDGHIVYQHRLGLDPAKITKSVPNDDFAVWLKNCTFLDRSHLMMTKIDQIFHDRAKTHPRTADKRQATDDLVKMVFRDTSIKIQKNMKVCLMGSEHSGIDLFFLALHNELELESGEMFVNGRVVIFDKKRFHLMSEQSFRENIVLDSPFNKERYDEICKLLDLNFYQYRALDYTKIADNFKFIPNVVKIKVLLARALYQEFDILCLYNLFDMLHFEDKLPLYERLVEQYLMHNTVFYYAKDPELAKRSDLILLFRDGKIVEMGRHKELSLNPSSKYS